MNKSIILKIGVTLLCMAFTAGIYTFIVIPSVRSEEKRVYESKLSDQAGGYINVLTYNGDTPLLSSTVITESLEDYFGTVQMPVSCASAEYVSEFEDILGLQLEYTICTGQQVSFQNFRKFVSAANGDEKLKEFRISSLVAGQAVPGRFVDILIRYPDGSCAVVVPKIQIYDIQQIISVQYQENAQDGYTAVFAVTDEEYNDITDACREGVLDIRIYLNEAQKPSVKTYSPNRIIGTQHNGI